MKRLALLLAVFFLAACHPRPFADGSAWNRTLPDNPVVDANSGTYIAQIAAGANVLNTREYGVPVFVGDSPRKTINCSASYCQVDGQTATVPSGAHGAPGGDGAMAAWDPSRGQTYDFWRVGSITTSVINSADASISCTANDNPACDGNGVTTTGSGISRLAGVFTQDDYNDGHIPHALVFSSYTVDNSTAPCEIRYPATKNDGCGQFTHSGVSRPLPEGAVLKLDASFDVDGSSYPEWKKMMLRAMQTYGAVAIDSGGAASAFIADELPIGDYSSVDDFPWSRIRVLRNWQGT